jgi:alpha-tubulin suppressor-like RCC1 family protein
MTPISMVAAITPNSSAPPPGNFRHLPITIPVFRLIARVTVACAAVVLASCTETTSPPRRYATLDDEGSSDWQTVTVGADHSCAIKTNGNAYCWGSNRSGQLSVARLDTVCVPRDAPFRCSMTPQQVQPGAKFSSIIAGVRHTCALTTSREAYCWGANDQNQLGNFSPGGPTLVKIPGSLPWAQVSAGATHSCAIRSDGALFCWGANDRGQLGTGGSAVGGQSIARVRMPGPVVAVSAGEERTCARTTSGAVYCWGAVWTSRENGLEVTRSQTTPELVPGSPAMVWLSVGSFTTCGSDASGFAYCWEANPRGEMGTGDVAGSTTPKRVATDIAFVQLSAGIVQSCGVADNGAGYCWGDDSFGQIGVSPSLLIERCGGQQLPCSTKPVPVFGRQQFTEISTGFGSHTCGVTTRGNLYCWGLGVSGQRGDGTASLAVTIPILVREPTS